MPDAPRRRDWRSGGIYLVSLSLNPEIFTIPVLTASPRWKHGSIGVSGINPETEEIEFSGSEGSFAVSGRINEALFEGRKLVDAVAGFGKRFWHYNFTNPATGPVDAKRAYIKLVHVQGAPPLIGAGYNPTPIALSNQYTVCSIPEQPAQSAVPAFQLDRSSRGRERRSCTRMLNPESLPIRGERAAPCSLLPLGAAHCAVGARARLSPPCRTARRVRVSLRSGTNGQRDHNSNGHSDRLAGTGELDRLFATRPRLEIPKFRIPPIHPDALDLVRVGRH